MPDSFEDVYAKYQAALGLIQRLDKFFIIGCAKSGTTWLMNLLHGHPEIIARGEGSFTSKLAPHMLRAFAAFNEGRDQDETYMRDIDQMLAVRQVIDGRFLRYVNACAATKRSVRFVADKTPQHTVSVAQLNSLYPRARFVHIIRDPRDATTSALHHIAKTDSRPRDEYIRYFMTTVWPLNVTAARAQGLVIRDQYMELRYEDLLSDEVGQLKRVLRFLGAADDEMSVRACLDSGSFEKRSGGRKRGVEDRESFYRRGVAGDWVNHLPADIVRECCEKIAPVMSEFGYDPRIVTASAAA